jgi:hypothetical protein
MLLEQYWEKEEAKTDRTKKGWLHPQVELIHLNTASSDDHNAASNYNEDFKSFFNSDSSGAVGKHFLYLLVARRVSNTQSSVKE